MCPSDPGDASGPEWGPRVSERGLRRAHMGLGSRWLWGSQGRGVFKFQEWVATPVMRGVPEIMGPGRGRPTHRTLPCHCSGSHQEVGGWGVLGLPCQTHLGRY